MKFLYHASTQVALITASIYMHENYYFVYANRGKHDGDNLGFRRFIQLKYKKQKAAKVYVQLKFL